MSRSDCVSSLESSIAGDRLLFCGFEFSWPDFERNTFCEEFDGFSFLVGGLVGVDTAPFANADSSIGDLSGVSFCDLMGVSIGDFIGEPKAFVRLAGGGVRTELEIEDVSSLEPGDSRIVLGGLEGIGTIGRGGVM